MESKNHIPDLDKSSESRKSDGVGQHAFEDENTSGRLSDYPDGNLDEAKLQTDSIPGNQTDRPEAEE